MDNSGAGTQHVLKQRHQAVVEQALEQFRTFQDGVHELRRFTKIFKARTLNGEDYISLVMLHPATMMLHGLATTWHEVVLMITLALAARLTTLLPDAVASESETSELLAVVRILLASVFRDGKGLFQTVKSHKLSHIVTYIQRHGTLRYQSTSASEKRNKPIKIAVKRSSRRHNIAEQVLKRVGLELMLNAMKASDDAAAQAAAGSSVDNNDGGGDDDERAGMMRLDGRKLRVPRSMHASAQVEYTSVFHTPFATITQGAVLCLNRSRACTIICHKIFGPARPAQRLDPAVIKFQGYRVIREALPKPNGLAAAVWDALHISDMCFPRFIRTDELIECSLGTSMQSIAAVLTCMCTAEVMLKVPVFSDAHQNTLLVLPASREIIAGEWARSRAFCALRNALRILASCRCGCRAVCKVGSR